MAPPGKDNSASRRKSMNPFSRGSLASLTQINTDVANISSSEDGEKKDRKKLSKRSSVFGVVSSGNPDLKPDAALNQLKADHASSPRLRPKTLQRGRPSSLFGSLGRKSMISQEDGEGGENLMGTTPESPLEDGGHFEPDGIVLPTGKTVLHHGEIQTTSGMFRKKKEYLVLTDTHLLRFKSQSRASESFPTSIPPIHRRSTTRHPSTTSIPSLQEVQSTTSHASGEGENRIPLGQVVTAYKVEDGRPFFTTEVVYLDEELHGLGSIQLMQHDPKEADLWHTSIRAAAQKARLIMEEPFAERIIRYLVQALEGASDYDANHFSVFRVVKRQAIAKGGKGSSDDLQKLNASVFYMVIGINRIHLIPLPDFGEPAGRSLTSKASRSTFGIVTLVSMNVNYTDDRFEIAFRIPMQPPKVLELAASATTDIAVVVFRAFQYLKPLWLDYNFMFNGPKRLLDNYEIPTVTEEYGCFDRTLIAYCMAYNVNPVNIQYTINWDVEDAPEFQLLNPAGTAKYSLHEMLAIMRSLRYNESFHSLSFRDVDLHCMHNIRDILGTDHIAWTSRSGLSITKYFSLKPQEKSLLYQEVQAIALKSRRLRRVDFSNCLPKRRPKDTFDIEGLESEQDPGCEIVAAIAHLCKGQLTDINWISISGIELGETDLDAIIPALNEVQSRLRAIDFSRCGMSDRIMLQLLHHMERQNATLEVINISDNPGKINFDRFQASMSRFSKIRKLDVSRILRTPGDLPLFRPEIMLTWRLEELILNGVPVNEQTLDSISTYLASGISNSLKVLQMDQCNLTGTQVAFLMRAMTRTAGEAREIHLHVSANKLEKGVGSIVEAIEENFTPAHLSVRMIEFTKEDHFKRLVQALRTNTTIRTLDLSKASLPYDASPETCNELRLLFAENTTLEELDISGEQAHLEVTRFGIGLNHALTGLKSNKTLRVLSLEYQNLGLEGANTLSSVLEENTGLTSIFCEHNDINLQGFTILVNALANNYTIIDIPLMITDQGESMKRMTDDMRKNAARSQKEHHNVKTSMRKTLTTLGVTKQQKEDYSPQDFDVAFRVLGERWESEMQRMTMFLERNRNIAAGLDGYGPDGDYGLPDEAMRPSTALSDHGVLEQALTNTTPKGELGNPVDDHAVRKLAGLGINEAAAGTENEKVDESEKDLERELEGNTSRPRTRHRAFPGDVNGDSKPPELPVVAREKMFELDAALFEMEN